jgi:hypothetical protein
MRNPRQLIIVSISMLGLSDLAPAVAQDIYKWVDDEGLVNYADVVPPNVTAQLLDQRIFYNSQRDDGPHRPRVKYNVVTEQASFDPNALSPTAAGPTGKIQEVGTQNR